MENTIEMLKQAQIKFWILTGDKLETAINIGYATKVLSPLDEVVFLDD